MEVVTYMELELWQASVTISCCCNVCSKNLCHVQGIHCTMCYVMCRILTVLCVVSRARYTLYYVLCHVQGTHCTMCYAMCRVHTVLCGDVMCRVLTVLCVVSCAGYTHIHSVPCCCSQLPIPG